MKDKFFPVFLIKKAPIIFQECMGLSYLSLSRSIVNWLIYLGYQQKQPPEVLKRLFLKISENSQENNCARVSFLWRRCFLVNFVKFFTEHLFYRTPLDDCFCINIFKTTVFIGITKGRISYFMVFSIPEAATGGVL